jgi:hypothetical protein
MAIKWVNGKIVEVLDIFENDVKVWHIDRPIRIVIPDDVWRDWFSKRRDHEDYYELTGKQLYPELVAIIGYVRNIDSQYIVKDSGATYIYLEELYPEHEMVLNMYGAVKELKQQ